MQTDKLIHVLARDFPEPRRTTRLAVAGAAFLGFLVSLAGFWAIMGPRSDIESAAVTVRFNLKIAEMLFLAGAAYAVATRLAVPGAEVRKTFLVLLSVPAVMAASALIEMALLPPQSWWATMVGSNWMICLTAVPLLSLPILAALLFGLRHGAPTRPELTGAVAGLVASGLAAAVYALHCTDDSPLFVVVWYSISVVVVSLVGALVGRRVLKW